MATYYKQDKDEVSREGLIGTILFHLILLLCFFFWTMHTQKMPEKVKGLIVNFGNSERGGGAKQPNSSKAAAASAASEKSTAETKKATKPSKSTPKPVTEKRILESNKSDAPAIPKKEKKKADKSKKTDTKKNTKTEAKKSPKKSNKKEKDIKPQKKEEIVDKNALYPGSQKQTNDSQSQGPDKDVMNDLGALDGNPDINSNNTKGPSTANGAGFGGFDLTGRSLTKSPRIKDNSQLEGVIVVKVKVDKRGNVISAQTTRGSTITDLRMRAKAEESAKSAKFNFAPDAPEVQSGTITFNFNLK